MFVFVRNNYGNPYSYTVYVMIQLLTTLKIFTLPIRLYFQGGKVMFYNEIGEVVQQFIIFTNTICHEPNINYRVFL